jgi:hypothetical protein
VIFPEKVKMPETQEDILSAMSDYARAGFPGAIGSMDVVHIWLAMSSAELFNLLKGAFSIRDSPDT